MCWLVVFVFLCSALSQESCSIELTPGVPQEGKIVSRSSGKSRPITFFMDLPDVIVTGTTLSLKLKVYMPGEADVCYAVSLSTKSESASDCNGDSNGGNATLLWALPLSQSNDAGGRTIISLWCDKDCISSFPVRFQLLIDLIVGILK